MSVYDKNNAEQQKEKNNFDFLWLEYEEIDFEKLATASCSKLINSFCIRKGLIRYNLEYFRQKFQIFFKFYFDLLKLKKVSVMILFVEM